MEIPFKLKARHVRTPPESNTSLLSSLKYQFIYFLIYLSLSTVFGSLTSLHTLCSFVLTKAITVFKTLIKRIDYVCFQNVWLFKFSGCI